MGKEVLQIENPKKKKNAKTHKSQERKKKPLSKKQLVNHMGHINNLRVLVSYECAQFPQKS